MPILSPGTSARPISLPWRHRLANAAWFGRSVRTQILIVFVLINLVAASVAGGVIVYKAGVATRIEIAASMRLAEPMVSEAVQLIQQGMSAEPLLKALPAQLRFVRHLRIAVRDATGAQIADADRGAAREGDRAPAPGWFAALIGPPIEHHDVPVVRDGRIIGSVEIVSEPRDEIAEVWENTVALAAVAGITNLVVIGILYLVLGRVLDPLSALGSGLQGLERRDYKVRLARPKVAEFAAITDRFNALAGALDAARAENLALSRRLVTAQDDERRSTALELHDEVGPTLFGLKANAASIAKAAETLTTGAPSQEAARTIAERVRDLTAIIDHLQGINRNILNRLRPMALGHVPLRDMIDEMIRERARQHPAIAFTPDIAALERSYGDTIDLTVYRCLQESLTNAIRHADATAIVVRLVTVAGAGPHDGAGRLELTVRDDGRGIAEDAPLGFGLRGMRERVQALGGEFSIASEGGTCLRMAIPVPGRPDDAAEPLDPEAGSAR